MNATLLIARRELSTYLNTRWGWLILAAVLIVDGLLFNAFAISDKPQYSAEVLENFFYLSSGTTMIAGLILTLKLLAEERQSGTLVLLESAPISESQVVIGKFLGAWGFLMLITALSIYMPALVFVNGKVSWAQIGAGYLGLASLGAATVAIGTFASSIAKNQVFAAIAGALILVTLLLGWLLARVTEAPVSEILAWFALYDRHYQPFMRGRINTEDLAYYGSVVFAFLLLSTRVLQARRWS
jgi:ABC-2 type transport system permease protein